MWAPYAERIEVALHGSPQRYEPLQPGGGGYHHVIAEGAGPGTRYMFRLNGERELPDPASRFQPEGVHGPSEVVDPSAFHWSSGTWEAPPLDRYVLYELHTGTFSPEGTFDGIVNLVDYLKELGVTALELMPVAQFPGGRNWGYDGVFPYAVQDTYGGPTRFARLVDECHRRGLAVVLDVVYNHLGPEGDVMPQYGPYFTDAYRTPWGPAMNFSEAGSDEVRRFFIENALMWFEDYRVDALRLDAVHGIVDPTARPFLEELAEQVDDLGRRLGRKLHLISESALNDPRVVRPSERGGWGHDAQWNDDFHHALHAVLTGERQGYYRDFGSLGDLGRALREGFVYQGQFSPFRGRRFGAPADDVEPGQLVVFAQNHDQTGNRMLGERLTALCTFEQLKLVAGVVLLSPFIPLLFMGEEYGEEAPFPYFVSHSEPELVEAVRRGRATEFAAFSWKGEALDAQDEGTFTAAKLDHSLREQDRHRQLLDLHRELLRLRRERPALARLTRKGLHVEVDEPAGTLTVLRQAGGDRAFAAFHFGHESALATLPAGSWSRALDSVDERWGGAGTKLPEQAEGGTNFDLAPDSFVLYVHEGG